SSSCCCSAGRSDSSETALSSLTSSTGSAAGISSAGVGGSSLSMGPPRKRILQRVRVGCRCGQDAGAGSGSTASDVDDRVQVLVGEAGAQELGMDLERAG